MGAGRPKQYLSLAGQPVIVHALTPLLQHSGLSGVVVVISATDTWWPTVALPPTSTPLWVVTGGAERRHSVLNGLEALSQRAAPQDWVLVHDAARPCLTGEDLAHLRHELAQDAVGGLLAVPVRDTLKRADGAGRVAETVDRSSLWYALTPQMFRLGLLSQALREAIERGLPVTDEAAALEAAGFAPRLLEGRADNLKITRPEDLTLAEFYLTHGHRGG